MASKSRSATKSMNRTAPTRRRRAGEQPHPKSRRRRRVPWYRKRQTWGWAAAGTVAAGLLGWVLLAGRGEEATPSGNAPFVGGDLHSLVVDPNGTDRLYVGGHEGVAVSSNGGTTWRQLESLDGADAMAWGFQDERVLVGGHPGLFVSEDGGQTFEMRNEGLPATDVHALGAGEGVIYGASPAAGVFASTDDGRTWQLRTREVGHAFMGRILVDPREPDHLIAPDMEAGAAESTDGGRTWQALGGVGGAMWVTWDPADTDHLIVSGMGEAAESTDGGSTWRALTVPQDASVIEMDPTHPETLYAGVLDGTEAVIFVSTDGGASWTTP
jgi:photosystem II stability/assembly factor-like uncharacterized protein